MGEPVRIDHGSGEGFLYVSEHSNQPVEVEASHGPTAGQGHDAISSSGVGLVTSASTVTGSVPPPPPVPAEGSYAVIDLETTGLSANRGDRVIEVGVVVTDGHGRIDYEWSTLIDPTHDPGPTHLHGITAAMIVDAPTFGEVADDLAHVLRGRTLVAHNAGFDMSFLRAEWSRIGRDVSPSSLCTMAAARRAGLKGGLSACCRQLGIEIGSAHHALDDARAAATVLAHLGPPPDQLPPPLEITWQLPPWSNRGLRHRVVDVHRLEAHRPG